MSWRARHRHPKPPQPKLPPPANFGRPDPIDGGLFGAARPKRHNAQASWATTAVCAAEEVRHTPKNCWGGPVAFDTETTSLRAEAALVGLSFSTKAGEAVYIPVDSPDASQHLALPEVLAILQPVFAKEGIESGPQPEVRPSDPAWCWL